MDPENTPRATEVLRAGTWPEAEARDAVLVDFDDRFRRRKLYTGQGGLAFLLDLPEAMVLREGDGLALATGGFVRVKAAPEPLVEITAKDHEHFARIAWHLGNRHLPTQIDGERLLIRDDHVIATATLTMAPGLLSCQRSITRWVSLRMASSRSTSPSGGSPP